MSYIDNDGTDNVELYIQDRIGIMQIVNLKALGNFHLKLINQLLLIWLLLLAITRKLIKRILRKTKQNFERKLPFSFENQEELEQFLLEEVIQDSKYITIHASVKNINCKNFNAKTFLDFLKSSCRDGVLLIPAFTMRSTQYAQLRRANVCHNGSDISTGVLSKLAYQDGDFELCAHPSHSYLIYNPSGMPFISRADYNGLTTDGSPLKSLEDREGVILNLGVGLNQTTFIHCVEEMESIFPFDSLGKSLSGIVSTDSKEASRSFCVKPLKPYLYNIRECDQLKPALIESGALTIFERNGAIFQKIGMNTMRNTMCELSKQGRTIYGRFWPLDL